MTLVEIRKLMLKVGEEGLAAHCPGLVDDLLVIADQASRIPPLAEVISTGTFNRDIADQLYFAADDLHVALASLGGYRVEGEEA